MPDRDPTLSMCRLGELSFGCPPAGHPNSCEYAAIRLSIGVVQGIPRPKDVSSKLLLGAYDMTLLRSHEFIDNMCRMYVLYKSYVKRFQRPISSTTFVTISSEYTTHGTEQKTPCCSVKPVSTCSNTQKCCLVQ
jgi:hypothetical protein